LAAARGHPPPHHGVPLYHGAVVLMMTTYFL
jgi:hypothetical protein